MSFLFLISPISAPVCLPLSLTPTLTSQTSKNSSSRQNSSVYGWKYNERYSLNDLMILYILVCIVIGLSWLWEWSRQVYVVISITELLGNISYSFIKVIYMNYTFVLFCVTFLIIYISMSWSTSKTLRTDVNSTLHICGGEMTLFIFLSLKHDIFSYNFISKKK